MTIEQVDTVMGRLRQEVGDDLTKCDGTWHRVSTIMEDMKIPKDEQLSWLVDFCHPQGGCCDCRISTVVYDALYPVTG